MKKLAVFVVVLFVVTLFGADYAIKFYQKVAEKATESVGTKVPTSTSVKSAVETQVPTATAELQVVFLPQTAVHTVEATEIVAATWTASPWVPAVATSTKGPPKATRVPATAIPTSTPTPLPTSTSIPPTATPGKPDPVASGTFPGSVDPYAIVEWYNPDKGWCGIYRHTWGGTLTYDKLGTWWQFATEEDLNLVWPEHLAEYLTAYPECTIGPPG